VERVDLRGRGGAGFPLARKLRAVRDGRGRKVVVVNGAESEPASKKDAVLMHHAPHLPLDGAQLAARIVGAEEIIVWIHRDPGRAAHPIETAVAERAAAGLDGVFTRVERGPARYVAGESSALVRHLSGGWAKPTMSPPHATERGVLGRPTLVSNAETLAQLALLGRHGPDWFREVGTGDEPGTTLLTLYDEVGRPTVVETRFGTSIAALLDVAGVTTEPRAVLVGGYSGTWLPWSTARSLSISQRALHAVGASLGVGLVAVLPEGRCGLVETSHLVWWLAGETAGQCGPCVNGLPAIAEAFDDLAAGAATSTTIARLRRWTEMVTGRGACHHPDGVSTLVRSALRTFVTEVGAHLHHHPCAGHRAPPLLPLPLAADQQNPQEWE